MTTEDMHANENQGVHDMCTNMRLTILHQQISKCGSGSVR